MKQDLRAARLVQQASSKILEERATANYVLQVSSSEQPMADRMSADRVGLANTRIIKEKVVAKVVRQASTSPTLMSTEIAAQSVPQAGTNLSLERHLVLNVLQAIPHVEVRHASLVRMAGIKTNMKSNTAIRTA